MGGKPSQAGATTGGAGMSGGGAGGKPAAGAGGKPEAGGGSGGAFDDVPVACELCHDNTMAFCDVSSVHPDGACIGCPENGADAYLYRDCDGSGPEHYVSKNDHDPGYGCETFVGYMGSCPN
jgi:hypothetical protein